MLGKTKNTNAASEIRSKIGTLVGAGAVFNGDLSAPETIRIDCIITGNCTCEKDLILGAEGAIKGNISVQNVIISGKVEGDISARGKLELLSTGRVVGNITAKSLVIDEDAYFDGRCIMASDSQKGIPVHPASAALEDLSKDGTDESL